MKKTCHVDLPNIETSDLNAIRKAAAIKDMSFRKFVKHSAIDTAKKILMESKR